MWRRRGPAPEHRPPTLGSQAPLIPVTQFRGGHPHFPCDSTKAQRSEGSSPKSHRGRALTQTPRPAPLAQISFPRLENAPNDDTQQDTSLSTSQDRCKLLTKRNTRWCLARWGSPVNAEGTRHIIGRVTGQGYRAPPHTSGLPVLESPLSLLHRSGRHLPVRGRLTLPA